jgi:D-alanyl-D-alanine carboxypeptidase
MAPMTDGPIAKLVAAYPDFLAWHDADTLTWKDGTVMILDDGKGEKDPETRLNEPDLKDMFYTSYPQGRSGIPPQLDCDPGRVRYQPFFDKMYGDCQKGEVKPKLVRVDWLPQHGGGVLRVTSVNKVADRFRAVSAELDKLPDSLVKYVVPLASKGYNCRAIAGTTRPSVHGHGIAIDINVAWSNYWRYRRTAAENYSYENRIPWEIVEVFEKHGFIWGGKWYHFDTMHFEYRPEMLL